MTLQRALWVGFWLFVVFYIVTSPEQASAAVKSGLGLLAQGADQVVCFAKNLFS